MQDIELADLVDAEPAPRALSPTSRRYIAGQATYFWGVMAVIFLLLPSALMAWTMKAHEVYTEVGLMVVITAALFVRAAIVRHQLRAIIVDGAQRPAQIVNMQRLHVRGGHRDTLWLDVDGRRVKCSSWAGDLENAEAHAWIRVLAHPAYPRRAVPVVSVT